MPVSYIDVRFSRRLGEPVGEPIPPLERSPSAAVRLCPPSSGAPSHPRAVRSAGGRGDPDRACGAALRRQPRGLCAGLERSAPVGRVGPSEIAVGLLAPPRDSGRGAMTAAVILGSRCSTAALAVVAAIVRPLRQPVRVAADHLPVGMHRDNRAVRLDAATSDDGGRLSALRDADRPNATSMGTRPAPIDPRMEQETRKSSAAADQRAIAAKERLGVGAIPPAASAPSLRSGSKQTA